MRESECKACGAKILWVVTEKKLNGKGGNRMPVDFAPSPEGNLMIVADGASATAYVVPREKLATLSQLDRAGLRVSHFATCPKRQQFKGAKIVESEKPFDWPEELEASNSDETKPLVPAFTRAQMAESRRYQALIEYLVKKHSLSYLANSGGGEFIHPTVGRCQVFVQSPREDYQKLQCWLVANGLESGVQEVSE